VNQGKQKALFIDRDGIINEDTGYPHKPEHIRFHGDIFPLLKKAQDAGYLLIVITNQAGVAKGKFTEQDVVALHEWMKGEFLKRSITIARFYYCPHHAQGTVEEYRRDCDCRKPKPGMVIQALHDFPIDPASSLVVGDKTSDRIRLPGLRSVIVKSKYTGDDYDVEQLSSVASYLRPTAEKNK
jgi:D-glycero-D-manno-heptose 1,7-bisphosphate phosphatase